MFLYRGNRCVITGPNLILFVIADKFASIVQQSKSIFVKDSHSKSHQIPILKTISKPP